MRPVGKGSAKGSAEGERRSRWRYPLSLPVVYDDGRSLPRPGRTLDISASGLRFTTPQRPVRLGQQLQVSMALPGRCDGSVAVALKLHGEVVRADRDEAAIRLERYEFEAEACSGACRSCPKAPHARKAPESASEASPWSEEFLPDVRRASRARSMGGA